MTDREMAIVTTFTYDKETDVIGWFAPSAHRSMRPKIHKSKRGNLIYSYCRGRSGKTFPTDLIKETLRSKK